MFIDFWSSFSEYIIHLSKPEPSLHAADEYYLVRASFQHTFRLSVLVFCWEFSMFIKDIKQ